MQNSSWKPSHGGNLAWAASLAGCSPLAILDFSASINPLGPPQSAIAAIQAHLNQLPHYPDPTYQQLRQVLGEYHQLSADWILPGNGSAELLTWAGRDLATLDATYLITPAFGDYLRALKAFGGEIVACPIELSIPIELNHNRKESSACAEWSVQWSVQVETGIHPLPLALPPAAQPSGFLLNNPHNPTGQLFSASTIVPLLEEFALVVVDEAFMDFLPLEHQQSLIEMVADYPNLVVLRSLTKFYSLPGLRLGYAIAHPDRLRCWQQWRDPWTVNVLAEAAAIAVLQDTPFQQHTWAWLKAARSQLFQGLAALPGLHPFPGAANFLLVGCERSVTQLQQQLLTQYQILIRDCHSFPELGDSYFRVAVRTLIENQRLLEGLANILGNEL